MGSWHSDLPLGSIGAGGLRESEGREVYSGSSREMKPGELLIVMFLLRKGQDSTTDGAFDSHRDVLGGSLTSDKALPRLVALVNDLGGVLLVLGLAREREGVFGLSIGNLVDPEGQTDR